MILLYQSSIVKHFEKKKEKYLRLGVELKGMPSQCCDMDSNGDKKELKGTRIVTYRFRVEDYRVFYQIDEAENEVYVFDVLTAEQAHKKYGRM